MPAAIKYKDYEKFMKGFLEHLKSKDIKIETGGAVKLDWVRQFIMMKFGTSPATVKGHLNNLEILGFIKKSVNSAEILKTGDLIG